MFCLVRLIIDLLEQQFRVDQLAVQLHNRIRAVHWYDIAVEGGLYGPVRVHDKLNGVVAL